MTLVYDDARAEFGVDAVEFLHLRGRISSFLFTCRRLGTPYSLYFAALEELRHGLNQLLTII